MDCCAEPTHAVHEVRRAAGGNKRSIEHPFVRVTGTIRECHVEPEDFLPPVFPVEVPGERLLGALPLGVLEVFRGKKFLKREVREQEQGSHADEESIFNDFLQERLPVRLEKGEGVPDGHVKVCVGCVALLSVLQDPREARECHL